MSLKKKIIFLSTLCFLTVSLGGCKKDFINDSLKINPNIESKFSIEEGGHKYSGEIIHLPEGVTNISFNYPENLDGFSLEFKNGKYVISQKKLSGEYSLNPLEEKSIINFMVKALDSLKSGEKLQSINKQDEKLVFKKNIDGTDFEVIADSNGKILKINIPSKEAEINFA